MNHATAPPQTRDYLLEVRLGDSEIQQLPTIDRWHRRLTDRGVMAPCFFVL